MLFARFLAENDLLIEPDNSVAISLAECEELARLRAEDWLSLASSFAVRMLPQIFRQGDPVIEVRLPPETRSKLEDLLKDLAKDVFLADDSLGWVYQFWQADRKEEINKSERKIGADEIAAVTQLFTEDYMVLFLLHNTLGAWWAGKFLALKPELARSAKSEDELRSACSVNGIDWTYLRFIRDTPDRDVEGVWRPAAGTFEGWPKAAKEITLLDPCMGSGHFLVFALPILVAFRMAEEKLSREAAVGAALRDNIFGLEIDQRCTQIAAFNLAFAAWRMAGYRQLPTLNLACSGLAPAISKAEWIKLAEQAVALAPVSPKLNLSGSKDNIFSRRVKDGIARLYDLFSKAPWLGSLIDPHVNEVPLAEATLEELEHVLSPLLRAEDDLAEAAVAAQGMAKAAELLVAKATLIATNVPYLGRGGQDRELRSYCESRYSLAKADLATCFVIRCLGLCREYGTAAIVTPQNWLFLSSYRRMREHQLRGVQWNVLARLGEGSFESPQAAGAFTALLIQTRASPTAQNILAGIDASRPRAASEKGLVLREGPVALVPQRSQLANPDSRISFSSQSGQLLLLTYCDSFLGLGTGDYAHYGRCFWEFPAKLEGWAFQQGTVDSTCLWGGRHYTLAWDFKLNRVRGMSQAERDQIHNQDQSGQQAWGKKGIAVGLMRDLKATIYSGERHDKALAALVPKSDRSDKILPALWSFCSSRDFYDLVRQLDHNIIVANGTLVKIPFDLEYWQAVAQKNYPEGLPKPDSSDPTEWLFSGNPKASGTPLHAASARLVGYRWPRQTGSSFQDCPSVGGDGLERHAEADGIACFASIKGHGPAPERLRSLLADAFGADWSAIRLASLLAEAGFANRSLDDWLRDGFFAKHCELFHQRPFTWHIWDGRSDGFNALVNYHHLAAPDGEGRRTLEKLIYSYLGTWIDLQHDAQRQGVEGADARLAAAEHLKQELEKILVGEPPYDIFVRWKPLHEQPIGWEPDINDGVRINIRPFLMAKPLGARGSNASILRVAPKINWGKDRGKEPNRPREDFPWFWGWDGATADFAGGKTFDGNRWNDLHYTNKFKQTTREQHSAPRAKAAR
jgi:hypothetical protein